MGQFKTGILALQQFPFNSCGFLAGPSQVAGNSSSAILRGIGEGEHFGILRRFSLTGVCLICYKQDTQSLSYFGFPAGRTAPIVFSGLVSEVLDCETRVSLLDVPHST